MYQKNLDEGIFFSDKNSQKIVARSKEEVQAKIDEFNKKYADYNPKASAIRTDKIGRFYSDVTFNKHTDANDPSLIGRAKRALGATKPVVKGAVEKGVEGAKQVAKSVSDSIMVDDSVTTKNLGATKAQLQGQYKMVKFGKQTKNTDGTWTMEFERSKTTKDKPNVKSNAPIDKASSSAPVKPVPTKTDKKEPLFITAPNENAFNNAKAQLVKSYGDKIKFLEPEIHSGKWKAEYVLSLKPNDGKDNFNQKIEPVSREKQNAAVKATKTVVGDTKEEVQAKVRKTIAKFKELGAEVSGGVTKDPKTGKFSVTITHDKEIKAPKPSSDRISNIQKQLSKLSDDKLKSIEDMLK